jgi:hypothetical protein
MRVSHETIGEHMMVGRRATFTAGFRLEAAQLVVDQDYIVKGSAEAWALVNQRWVNG